MHSLLHELTHCSQRIQLLLFILFLFFTKLLTSISIGQTLSHFLQSMHLWEFTGVILNNENLEKSPDIDINGQNILQYARLPKKYDRMKPAESKKIFSPIIPLFFQREAYLMVCLNCSSLLILFDEIPWNTSKSYKLFIC